MLLCSCRLRVRRVEIVVCAAKGWLGLALGTCRVWVTQSPSPQPLLQLCDRSPSAPLWPRGVAALGTHSVVGRAGVPVGQPDLGHTPSCHGLSRGEGRPHTWETCSGSGSGSGSDLRAAGGQTHPPSSLPGEARSRAGSLPLCWSCGWEGCPGASKGLLSLSIPSPGPALVGPPASGAQPFGGSWERPPGGREGFPQRGAGAGSGRPSGCLLRWPVRCVRGARRKEGATGRVSAGRSSGQGHTSPMWGRAAGRGHRTLRLCWDPSPDPYSVLSLPTPAAPGKQGAGDPPSLGRGGGDRHWAATLGRVTTTPAPCVGNYNLSSVLPTAPDMAQLKEGVRSVAGKLSVFANGVMTSIQVRGAAGMGSEEEGGLVVVEMRLGSSSVARKLGFNH